MRIKKTCPPVPCLPFLRELHDNNRAKTIDCQNAIGVGMYIFGFLKTSNIGWSSIGSSGLSVLIKYRGNRDMLDDIVRAAALIQA